MNNENNQEESKEQQEFNMIRTMEQQCHAEIRKCEKTASTEREHRREKEKTIHQ